jgi:CO dehydrogenase/acetyl-CoA synthase epsilon subunit
MMDRMGRPFLAECVTDRVYLGEKHGWMRLRMVYRSSRARLGALLGLAMACGSGCVIPLSVGDGRSDGDGGGASEGGTTEDANDGSANIEAPDAPELSLAFSQVKQFDFSWSPAAGTEHYQLLESAAPGEPFVQLGGDIVGESISTTMPLYARYQASYVLSACNAAGCVDSDPVSVTGTLAEAVGYVKASNTDAGDGFGDEVALSADGSTLAVGAYHEASNATGIDGDQADDSVVNAGAVYVFVRGPMGQWSQQAYIKASNTEGDPQGDPPLGDGFGLSVALSSDGNTLAVGAFSEDSAASGIDGNQADDFANDAGAAYVFVRDGAGQWSQQAYIKASNTDPDDRFGQAVALSGDGNTLAVGASLEDSNATGIDGNQADDSAFGAGAAYVFVRDGVGQWSQQAYVKASNPDAFDEFGMSVALSGDGSTLAVSAYNEDSGATGIDGNQPDDSVVDAGAVYVFVRDGMGQWSQQAYVKASNPDGNDNFGMSVVLNGDGSTLAVGAWNEGSNAIGIDGDQADDSLFGQGAVYVFVRDEVGQWSQQAYMKASYNGESMLSFGVGVALSESGDTLAVGATGEASNAIGIGGNQVWVSEDAAGAVYVFVRYELDQWWQQAYVKASNTDAADHFGGSVGLSGDGNTLAVGAWAEASNAVGIGGDQADESMYRAGAVYIY